MTHNTAPMNERQLGGGAPVRPLKFMDDAKQVNQLHTLFHGVWSRGSSLIRHRVRLAMSPRIRIGGRRGKQERQRHRKVRGPRTHKYLSTEAAPVPRSVRASTRVQCR